MEKTKETIQMELENNRKLLEVIKSKEKENSEIIRNYLSDFYSKLQSAIKADGLLNECQIRIDDYYGDGKNPMINIIFKSPKINSNFDFEMNVYLRNKEIVRTSISGISTDNSEKLTEVENYYKMVSNVFSKLNELNNFWKIMETYKKPKVEFINDYQLKETIRNLEKELKIAEMELSVGSEIEYFLNAKKGQYGKSWILVNVENITKSTITLKHISGNTYRVKKEDITSYLRKPEVKEN